MSVLFVCVFVMYDGVGVVCGLVLLCNVFTVIAADYCAVCVSHVQTQCGSNVCVVYHIPELVNNHRVCVRVFVVWGVIVCRVVWRIGVC